jgi:CPA2 family monovalent cation:H+ antiporter-2
MEIPILQDILIILGLGIVVLFLFDRIKIPPIVGFLLTGFIAGPYGFALVRGVHEVEIMAEIGVVLLLFALGLEFSFKKLAEIKKATLLGGSVQVFFTTAIVFLLAKFSGFSVPESIFLGFLIALSSTAIVLKSLQEKGSIASPSGRISLGILIFQDLIIIPMMLVTPVLAGKDSAKFSGISFLVKIILLLGFLYLSSIWLVPKILYQITRTRNRELFLMTVGFLGFSIAWLTSQIGLSLALGAFLAGLIISESEYSQNAFANILPLRDIFMGFFFVSIGMLLNVKTIINYPGLVLIIAAGILILKVLTAGTATLLLKYPMTTAIVVGLNLAQVGEFSFILSKTGTKFGLISDTPYQIFLAVSILTMMGTPFLIKLGQRADKIVGFITLPKRLKKRSSSKDDSEFEHGLNDHLIIIGYGLNGRNLTKAAKAFHIDYMVLDMNPETIQREKKEGIPIHFGDAAQEEVLRHANINKARMLVIAINDAAATRRITSIARQLNPSLHIIVRTRFMQEVHALKDLGADEVIPEEFETSIEIFNRVLKCYLINQNKIDELTNQIRSDNYQMFRKPVDERETIAGIKIPSVEIVKFKIPDGFNYINKPLSQLQWKQIYKINILVIFREQEIITGIQGDSTLNLNDEILVLGTHENIARFAQEIGF